MWPARSVFFGVTLLAAASPALAQTLDLVTGQQRVLSLPGVTRIAIVDPKVADVKVVGSGDVLVTAIAPGETDLTVWQGQKIVKYTVTVSEPSKQSGVTEALNRQLGRAGLLGARATMVGGTVFLEGVVDTQADLKKAEIITRALGGEVQNMLKVGAARMVELDVEFVEVSKSSIDRIGIRWPTDITADLRMTYSSNTVLRGGGADFSSFNATAVANASFGLALQFNDGITRTLARPRLVTASGREAKFLAGGEVPIPIVTDERMYIEYKEYGVRLQITPIVDGSGTVQTKILTEISDLDESVAVSGIPGLLSRRVDTEVTVHDGETIVLTGLMHVVEGKDVTKVPILGHIPIIGELFKSRRFRDRQTELVVFVTPRIVDPMSAHLKQLAEDMSKKYDEAEEDVGFSIFD